MGTVFRKVRVGLSCVFVVSRWCSRVLGLLAGRGRGGGGGGSGSPATRQSPPGIAAQTFNGTEDTVLTGQIAASDPGDA